MLARPLLVLAALGAAVSLWYLRSHAPSGMRVGMQRPARDAAQEAPPASPNAAEQLTQSHAMGVAGGIEMPAADAGASPGDAAWPGTREHLRGA